MKEVEKYLSEHREKPEDVFQWKIHTTKEVIEHWAELYKLKTYLSEDNRSFYYYYAVSEDIAVIVHFLNFESDLFEISANSFNYFTKEAKPILKTSGLGSIFGRGHTFENVLKALFKINERTKSVFN